MRFEFILLTYIDELCIGIFLANGEDDIGQFHMTIIGFLLFSINIFKYKKQ